MTKWNASLIGNSLVINDEEFNYIPAPVIGLLKEQMAAIKDTLNILGTGDCTQCKCEDCEAERYEAVKILTIFVAKTEGKECKNCFNGYVDFDPDNISMDLCPICKGSGVVKGGDREG